MAETPKKPLWKRALDKVLGTVDLKEHYNPFKESNMAPILTPKQAQAQKIRGLKRVYGEKELVKEGRRAHNRGEALVLPSYSDGEYYMPAAGGNAYSRGGFVDQPKDPMGNPLPYAPAQTYITPATHTGRTPTPQEAVDNYRDYLVSLYDFKKGRGEDLGDLDTFITNAMLERSSAVKNRWREPTPSHPSSPLAKKEAAANGQDSTRKKSGSSE